MIVKINNIDITKKVIAPSFKLIKSSNYQQELTFNIRDDSDFRSGMEIIVLEDDGLTVIFGGLIQEPKRNMATSTTIVQSIKSAGYRQVLSRRSFDVVVDNEKAGVVIEKYFDAFLSVDSPIGEGFIKGDIEEGINIPKKDDVFSAMDLFNDLATASGLSWWITDTKVFNFKAKPTYTDITRKLTDDTDEIESPVIETFVSLNYPEYKEDLSKYRNKQFVIGVNYAGDPIIGQAQNDAEIARMSSYYGSGVYGNIIKNKNIRNINDANNAALAELAAYSDIPATLTFTTTNQIDVNQRLIVDLSKHGIVNEYYTVDKISTTFDRSSAMLVRNVVLKKHYDVAKAVRTWTQDFDKGLRKRQASGDSDKTLIFNSVKNDTTVVVGPSFTPLPGIDVEFIESTKVAFDVQINATASESTNVTIQARIGGVSKMLTYKHYVGAYLDQIVFNGLFDTIASTTAVVDFAIKCDSGTLTINPDDYRARFTIEGGGAEEAPPAPVINVSEIVTSFLLDDSQEITVSNVTDSLALTTQTPTNNNFNETVNTITLDSNQITITSVSDSVTTTIT